MHIARADRAQKMLAVAPSRRKRDKRKSAFGCSANCDEAGLRRRILDVADDQGFGMADDELYLLNRKPVLPALLSRLPPSQ
jgi:hypothetical protein